MTTPKKHAPELVEALLTPWHSRTREQAILVSEACRNDLDIHQIMREHIAALEQKPLNQIQLSAVRGFAEGMSENPESETHRRIAHWILELVKKEKANK